MRTFMFFCLVVFILIAVSFCIKFVSVLQHSKFDGEHRFTILILHDKKSADVLSLDPEAHSASHVRLTDERDLPNPASYLGIPVDGIVRDQRPVDDVGLSDAFLSYAFRFHNKENGATMFDFLRAWLFTLGLDKNDISFVSLTGEKTSDEVDTSAADFFVDRTIANEKVPVAIVNASGISGRGSELERVLTNSGCTVVQVSTAPSQQVYSFISYADDNTYTYKKISSLLSYPTKKMDGNKLSDIIIVIGKDSITHPAF